MWSQTLNGRICMQNQTLGPLGRGDFRSCPRCANFEESWCDACVYEVERLAFLFIKCRHSAVWLGTTGPRSSRTSSLLASWRETHVCFSSETVSFLDSIGKKTKRIRHLNQLHLLSVLTKQITSSRPILNMCCVVSRRLPGPLARS